jgi:hypothetical protein
MPCLRSCMLRGALLNQSDACFATRIWRPSKLSHSILFSCQCVRDSMFKSTWKTQDSWLNIQFVTNRPLTRIQTSNFVIVSLLALISMPMLFTEKLRTRLLHTKCLISVHSMIRCSLGPSAQISCGPLCFFPARNVYCHSRQQIRKTASQSHHGKCVHVRACLIAPKLSI